MKHLQIYENYHSERIIKFSSKRGRTGEDIIIKVEGGRIKEVENIRNLKFPFNIGQPYNMSIKTWACNNGYNMDGQDPCPEQKIFGIRTKDIPQGHELRMMFPHKFKK
jgi:hypothetical protein